jgi:hypothetical protein
MTQVMLYYVSLLTLDLLCYVRICVTQVLLKRHFNLIIQTLHRGIDHIKNLFLTITLLS